MNSQNKSRLSILGIFAIAAVAGFLVFSQNPTFSGIPVPGYLKQPFKLGLDLQGGTHLVYNADLSQISESEKNAAIEGVRDVIERRVNAFGVAEPIVQTTESGGNHRLIIELAGINDVNEAIAMIGETPLLEFKVQNPNPTVELNEEQTRQLNEYNEQAKQRAQSVLDQAKAPGADFAALARQYSEDPGSSAAGGDFGYIARGITAAEFEKACFDNLQNDQITQELVQTEFGYHIIKRVDHRSAESNNGTESAKCLHILIATKSKNDFITPDQLWQNTELGGKQLERAVVQFDPNTNEPSVSLQFNEEGKGLFSQITQQNVGKPVAIFLDGQPISTPTVQEPITDGRAMIAGNFTIKEAKLLSQRLNAGALPVPIELVSQQTVGASLGKTSLTKSLYAGIFGLIAVSLFMILYYRLPGLLSVIALLFYGLIVLALFKLISVTLTLAGMAGFILSIGMAVDANVLIFERLREELKLGKPLNLATNEAFRRAWPSIFDGNISTLITCVILMGFTTSSVKGFAITLSIGIIASMFSAMIVTKILMHLVGATALGRIQWLYGAGIKKQ